MFHGKKAFSMLELVIGVCIFGLAILPLIWLSTNQTKSAFSVGKHLMAGQIATSFLDKMLKLPFDDCRNELKKLRGKKEKVLLNEDMIKMLDDLADGHVRDDVDKSFRFFKYQFSYDDTEADSEKILRVNIEVFYNVVENDDKTEQSLVLSALKFGDKNG